MWSCLFQQTAQVHKSLPILIWDPDCREIRYVPVPSYCEQVTQYQFNHHMRLEGCGVPICVFLGDVVVVYEYVLQLQAHFCLAPWLVVEVHHVELFRPGEV